MLPEAKMMKKISNTHSIICDLSLDIDLDIRFQMFKICEIRSFSYVAGN